MSEQPPLPRYGVAALADLGTSLLAAFGVSAGPNVLELPGLSRACVLVIDGLGWELLRTHPEQAPFLTSLLPEARVLTAGFPATTATSLASLGTGLTPGDHGMVGYTVAIPGAGRLLNELRWDEGVDPREWQPSPTIYERAAAAGVTVGYVSYGAFAGSGLSRATIGSGRYVPADSLGELVAAAAGVLSEPAPALAMVYHPDLDATGHRKGCHSAAWRFQLAHVDRLAEQLAGALPAGTTLYVTADHGMVDVGASQRLDADAVPQLRHGVELLGGEARARHVYARPGAADEVLAAWREAVGDRMWVVAREDAIAQGWFGPRVPADMRDRVGDVVAASRGAVAVTASLAEPGESSLVGMHGSMTPEEQLVPLLALSVDG